MGVYFLVKEGHLNMERLTSLFFIFHFLFFPLLVTASEEDEYKTSLVEAIDIMQKQSIHRNEIDWINLRYKAMKELRATEGRAGYKNAMREAFRLINTNHSYLLNSDYDFLTGYSDKRCRFEADDNTSFGRHIGYIRVDTFSSKSPQEQVKYATKLQNQIRQQDSTELKAWIVDLRYNGGGNMYPMLAGVGPLLGNGRFGYFIYPDGDTAEFGYYEGASILKKRKKTIVESPYKVKNNDIELYILTSSRTASSGEALAIAFKEAPNTTFIGEITCGLATVNRNFKLKNQNILNLTVGLMADRIKNTYENGIVPDVEIEASKAKKYAVEVINSK